MKILPFALIAWALTLTACAKEAVVAPTGKGLCWYIAQQPDGSIKNNKVAGNIPSIEQCAAELERMRLRFLRMGGTQIEILGAYQGTFIFLKREGIFTASRFKGMRYPLLQRVNGKLVVPGAVVRAPAPQAPVDASPK